MSNHNDTSTNEVHAHPDNSKAIWRTLGILTVITLVELVVGMFIAPGQIEKNQGWKIWFNMFYMIMTLLKAFYIVAEFMHLRHEVKNLVVTIIFPLTLFIWFIIAFLWEGNSYKNLRDDFNPKIPVKMEQHSTTTTHSEHSEH